MRHPLSLRNLKGFTIVELLIVIVVIGILAAVVIVSYTGIQSAALDRSVQSDSEAVEAEVVRYQTKNAGFFSTDGSGTSVTWYSGTAANTNIVFTPSSGNIIDVVANNTDYCIRTYNPSSKTYNTLATAITKGSSSSACTTLAPSSNAVLVAGGGAVQTYTTLTWVQRTAAGSKNWNSVDMSSDGSKMVATVSGTDYIYQTLDSGATWTPITAAGSRSWYKATISDDGTKLAGSASTGFYNSTDSGATWTLRSITLSPGDSPASYGPILQASADGMKLILWIFNDDLCGGYYYVSNNSGTTWTSTNVYACGASALISADGTKMLAFSTYGYISRSSDSGVTWSQNTPAIGGQYWAYGSATSTMSSTALSQLTLPTTNNKLWKSTDNGLTWTEITSLLPASTYVTASSSNGQIQYAATNTTSGSVYVSTDFGVTWSAKTGTGNHNWRAVATSDDGATVVGVYGTGYIYTGTFQ